LVEAIQARVEVLVHARCLKLYVQNVHRNVKYRFSLKKADQFIAKTAIPRRKTVNFNH